MGRIKMVNENKKREEIKKRKSLKNKDVEVNKTARFVAIIILVMMVLSVVGFAMLGTGLDSNQEVNEQGIPKYLPFQQISQNGKLFWVGVLNFELFVFENIEGFDYREDLAQIAFDLKRKDSLNLVLDADYSDSNFPFVLEQKYSRAFDIPVNRIEDLNCVENSLILTNNLNHSFDGDCLVIATKRGEEERDSLILSYHLIVDQ